MSKIRWSIYENIEDFTNIINEKDFKSHFGEISGRKLKNAPRGFDKSFEHIDILKFKDYTIVKKLTNKDLKLHDFIDEVVVVFKKMYKFNSFINNALKD